MSALCSTYGEPDTVSGEEENAFSDMGSSARIPQIVKNWREKSCEGKDGFPRNETRELTGMCRASITLLPSLSHRKHNLRSQPPRILAGQG
jgi:PQ loop repeat